MACSTCLSEKPCKCKDKVTLILPSCPPATPCTGDECDEVFDARCIRYNGPGIPDYSIETGESLALVIQKILIGITNWSCISTTSICQSVFNITLSSVTNSGATVAWSPSPAVVDYTLQYKLASAGSWSSNSNTTNLIDYITGLTADSDYQLRIVSNSCGCTSLTYAFHTLV